MQAPSTVPILTQKEIVLISTDPSETNVDEILPRNKNTPKARDLFIPFLDDVLGKIEAHRRDRTIAPTIMRTPFNDVSSRSHLFIEIELKFPGGVTTTLTVVDMAGRESPVTLWERFFSIPMADGSPAEKLGVALENFRKHSAKLDDPSPKPAVLDPVLIQAIKEGMSRQQCFELLPAEVKTVLQDPGKKTQLNRKWQHFIASPTLRLAHWTACTALHEKVPPKDITEQSLGEGGKFNPYTPTDMKNILEDSFFINQTINELIYFIKTKAHTTTTTAEELFRPGQTLLERKTVKFRDSKDLSNNYRENVIFTSSDTTDIDSKLCARLEEKLDKPREGSKGKPTKFVMMCMLRQEWSVCKDIQDTLDFAAEIHDVGTRAPENPLAFAPGCPESDRDTDDVGRFCAQQPWEPPQVVEVPAMLVDEPQSLPSTVSP